MNPRNALKLLTLGLALAAAPLVAQVTGATVEGTVTDVTGSVVPNAQVDVLRTSSGAHRTTTTNAAGSYTLPNLQSGSYTITITAPGFGTEITRNLNLSVGQNIELNYSLKLGAVVEQVDVTTTTPPVDLNSSQISNVIDSATVRQLPLNTRDWTLLATLEPGVSLVRTEKAVAVGADRGNRGFGAQLTIAGGRPQQNNYRLDGISINDYSNGAPGSVSGENLGVDAIQEFSVVTANGSAEYGREAGGVINAVSRAGTNQLHGTVFEFLRNDRFDANTYYFNPTRGVLEAEQELRKNQFGGALGGPIIKDKLFFFGNYEGIRLIQGTPFTVNAPSANARQGILVCSTTTGGVQEAGCPTPGPTAAGFTYTVPVTPDVASYLNFYGVPTSQPANSDTGSYIFYGRQVQPENFGQGRLDQTLSAKDTAHETFMFDDGNYTQPDAENNYRLLSHTRRWVAVGEENHIFSSAFVNSARFGVSRNLANITNTAPGPNALAGNTTLGGVPGTTASSLVVGTLTNFGGGLNAPSQYNFYWTSIQGYDDAFYTVRNHTIRFGGGFERMRNDIIATSSPAGLFTFSSVADFIANRVQIFSAQLPGSVPEKGLRQTLGAGYVLDDWKARKNLTFNIGLRYEATNVPTDVHNNLSHLANLTDIAPTLGSPYFSNPTYFNAEPRLGVIYDPFGTGKTVVRGGFGIFDVLPLPYQFELLASLAAPYLQVGSVNYSNSGPHNGSQPGDGKFAHGSYTSIATAATPAQPYKGLRQSYIQPNPSRSYLMEWNLNVEHNFARDYSAYLGFVGSRGVHQPFRSDEWNTVQPINYVDAQQPIFPCPSGGKTPGGATCPATLVLNPNVGQIAGIAYNNNTYYNGLQASLSKKMSHGFQGQVSYTFSKAIDLGSAILAGDPFGNSISGLFFFAPGTRRGVADFNVPQNLTVNALYEVPRMVRFTGAADALLNGWQLGGIFFAQNGLPFTPSIAGDRLGLRGSAPYDVPNYIGGCKASVPRPIGGLHDVNIACYTVQPTNGDGSNALGNATRNSVRGPRLNNLDFSMVKNTYLRSISDRLNLQFRAEAYNLFNHPNFSPPIGNRTLFNAGDSPNSSGVTTTSFGNYGNITTTAVPMRQIQLGVKILF